MAKEINVSAKHRLANGSAAARRLRREGMMPAILCDARGQSAPIQLNIHDFEQMLAQHAGENLLINLSLEGQEERKVLLREVQHDPLRGTVQHADFVEISLTDTMRITVPITLKGEPVGVSQQGGILEQLLREVEIECRAEDMVEELTVDVSALQMGQSLHISDIEVGASLTVLDEGDIAVATVAAPRLEEEVAEEKAEEEDQEEPEVISSRKKQEDMEKEAAGQ